MRRKKRENSEAKRQSFDLSSLSFIAYSSALTHANSLLLSSTFFFRDAIMAHKESTNEGGSSPDTVIARFSSDEEKQKPTATTSGEYVTAGDSNSSLDTLTSSSGGVATLFSNISTDDRKKGKFGAFKSSFRESGIFKIKKKSRETDPSYEANTEQDDKASLRKLEIGDDKG